MKSKLLRSFKNGKGNGGAVGGGDGSSTGGGGGGACYTPNNISKIMIPIFLNECR
jgi:hypothetical protein